MRTTIPTPAPTTPASVPPIVELIDCRIREERITTFEAYRDWIMDSQVDWRAA